VYTERRDGKKKGIFFRMSFTRIQGWRRIFKTGWEMKVEIR
jgi:hypothetical protein